MAAIESVPHAESFFKVSCHNQLLLGNILLLEGAFFREVKEALTTNEYQEPGGLWNLVLSTVCNLALVNCGAILNTL